jgi:hypothetical protein
VVSDQQIIADLKAMSNGMLVLDEETKLNGAEAFQKPGQQQGKKKKKKKQSNLKADMNNPNNPAYKKRKQQQQ